MAGGPAGPGIVSPGPRASFDGPLGGVGWAMSWVDYVVYKIEHGAVVTAMIAMTVIEFIYILSIYVVEQKINYAKWTDPDVPFEVPYGLIILLLFVGAMMAAIVNNTRLGKTDKGELRPLPLRIAACGFGHSSTMCSSRGWSRRSMRSPSTRTSRSGSSTRSASGSVCRCACSGWRSSPSTAIA